jgi:hypothetical protein
VAGAAGGRVGVAAVCLTCNTWRATPSSIPHVPWTCQVILWHHIAPPWVLSSFGEVRQKEPVLFLCLFCCLTHNVFSSVFNRQACMLIGCSYRRGLLACKRTAAVLPCCSPVQLSVASACTVEHKVTWQRATTGHCAVNCTASPGSAGSTIFCPSLLSAAACCAVVTLVW